MGSNFLVNYSRRIIFFPAVPAKISRKSNSFIENFSTYTVKKQFTKLKESTVYGENPRKYFKSKKLHDIRFPILEVIRCLFSLLQNFKFIVDMSSPPIRVYQIDIPTHTLNYNMGGMLFQC